MCRGAPPAAGSGRRLSLSGAAVPAPRSERGVSALAAAAETGERKKGSRQAGLPALFEFSWKDPSVTIAGESDLRQFLKVTCPHWLCPRPGGGSDINRVVEKLRGIGVFDAAQLVIRVTSGKINDDLVEAGYSRFSKDTIDAILKWSRLLRAMETLTEVNFRQTGAFAHVPQLLSQTNFRQRELKRIKGVPDSLRPLSPAEQMVQHLSTTSTTSRGAQSEGQPQLDALDSPMSRASLRGAAPQPRRRSSTVLSTSSSLPAMTAVASTPTARSREGWLESPGFAAAGTFARAATAGEVFPGSPSGALASRRHIAWPAMSPTSTIKAVSDQECAGMASEQHQPAWTSRKRPDQQAEAMLAEQLEIDERTKLFRLMKSQGQVSLMRKHIARNIRSHLKEVSGAETKDAIDMEHRCANIRKHLAGMVNSRRELNNLRRAIPCMSSPAATGK